MKLTPKCPLIPVYTPKAHFKSNVYNFTITITQL